MRLRPRRLAGKADANTHKPNVERPEVGRSDPALSQEIQVSVETGAAVGVAPLDDDFLRSIRIDQSYSGDMTGVKKPLLTVPVRKPTKTEFVRVHPDLALDCFMVELKTEGERYFVSPEVAPFLGELVEPVRLRLCVTRQGVVFLWPVKLPKDERRADAWRSSAAEAASLGMHHWVRIAADMNLGAYQPYVATADLGSPSWPEEPFPKVVQIALQDRLIRGEDHPVVQQLLGRA